ncbi:MAG: hypothetical protein B7O98_04070 [Zestosphaera tikiterensis]|uniref:DUF2192 domain-containing protein n=1 Tax=Zestosphaera tikiterensis TaxID=1973259 RepID=A0A2R7Y7T5_9CREN|nr:MAG: hypothetical protein B7O98_04070 [Zestosphaera tikiterensis]
MLKVRTSLLTHLKSPPHYKIRYSGVSVSLTGCAEVSDSKRRRVKAYVNALGELVNSEKPTRELAVELVKKYLNEAKVEPFRGASKPADIYEKELISIYVIATRGLKMFEDYRDFLIKVFEPEVKYEEVLHVLLSINNNNVREEVLKILPNFSEADIAKVLRLALTLYYLDFEPFETTLKALKKLYAAFPEQEDTLRRFAKFIVSVKLAEEIRHGLIKNRVDKEIRKQLISLETGIPKTTPSDDYVRKIADEVFEIDKEVLDKIFKEVGEPNTAEANTLPNQQ